MAQRIEAVVEALDELLARHGSDVVTDPAKMPALLARQLGDAPRDNPLLRAIVAASHTEALRALSTTTDLDQAVEMLERAIVMLGLPATDAADGARAWAAVLRNAPTGRDAATGAAPAVVATGDPTTGDDLGHDGLPHRERADDEFPDHELTDHELTDHEAEIELPVTEPDFFENEPTSAMPPAPPPVSPDATTATGSVPPPPLVPPVAPPAAEHLAAGGRDTTPPVADPGGGWPAKAKALLAVAAVAAVLLGILAFVGWNRDPSKEEAEAAQRQVEMLESDVAEAEAEVKAAEDETAAAKSTIAERDAALAAANAQIEASSTMTKTLYDNARWPATFAMSGFVAEGSCSLSAAACEKSAVVRDIVVSCGGAPCGCVDGGCTVTSELWKTPAPVTYDATSGLFTATGMLDGDQFTCGGVPQPTAFSFRFRATTITYDEGWVGSEFAAELAETSEATDACLAGGRTYALSGPAIG